MKHFKKRILPFNVMTTRDGVVNYTYDIYDGNKRIASGLSHKLAIFYTSKDYTALTFQQ